MNQIPNDAAANNGQIICVERDTENTFIKLATNLKTDGTCAAGKLLTIFSEI